LIWQRGAGNQNSSSNDRDHFPQIASLADALCRRPLRLLQRKLFEERWKVGLTLKWSQAILGWKVSFTWDESRKTVPQAITNRVKELRIALGWTQEQLAQAAGVSRQSINSIERDRYVPSLELALIFARIFSCPTDQIFQLESKS
jgi:putative transcriptional regulator